jgi:hypothetical protein
MNTGAILVLIRIIRNKSYVTSRRLEACETLLEYETEQRVVDFAMDFLEGIYTAQDAKWDDPFGVHVDHKLWALKLTRKLEARRIRQETVTHRSPHIIDIGDALRAARLQHMQKLKGD